MEWALTKGSKILFLPDQHLGRNTAVLSLGLSLDDCVLWNPWKPMGGLTEDQIKNASPEERLRLATPWREKALKDWSGWYFSVRPFEDRGGLDELQLAVPLGK